jgi:hypothetical protein
VFKHTDKANINTVEFRLSLWIDAPEDQQGFEMVANHMIHDIHKGAKEAQKGFYEIKGEDIGPKTKILKSVPQNRI